jgi:hypothetical protein
MAWQHRELLRDVLSRHAPHLVDLIETENWPTLTAADRESIRAALSEELAATGLKESSEPNDIGMRIEYLIDALE